VKNFKLFPPFRAVAAYVRTRTVANIALNRYDEFGKHIGKKYGGRLAAAVSAVRGRWCRVRRSVFVRWIFAVLRHVEVVLCGCERVRGCGSDSGGRLDV
jgi:hypothetical protein